MKFGSTPIKLIVLSAMLSMSPGLTTILPATPLDDRVEAFKAIDRSPTEADVIAVLELGLKEQRSAEAMAAVQSWLNRNLLQNDRALLLAGQAAERSGQWLAAVGYYQQLLQQDKPDPSLASPAIDATYRLLLNALNDSDAAYLYMDKDGHRLRSYGKARRYDRWFLDQARQRRDLIAVAKRLAAIAQDKQTKIEIFQDDLQWLIRELEVFRLEDAAVYERVRELAAMSQLPAKDRARLNWVATVMPYNRKLDDLRENNAPADSKLTDEPLAVAAELLKRDPNHGALTVMRGWTAEYDQSGWRNALERTSIERDRKLSQLLDIVPKLDAEQRDDLLAYRIVHGRIKFDPLTVQELVLKHPQMLNDLDVQNVRLFDKNQLTIEQAKKLAPLLARNPHTDAAIIRAIAQSESLAFSKIAEAMFETEAWRFDNPKAVLDMAWRASTEQDQPFKELEKQYPSFGKRYEELSQQTSRNADRKQRLAAFKTLRQDLTAKAPTISGSWHLWQKLFANAPEQDTVEMLRLLIADSKNADDPLLALALPHANAGGSNTIFRGPSNDYLFLRNQNNRIRYIKAMKPVTEALEPILTAQAGEGNLSNVLFGIWLHGIDPDDERSQALLKKLMASKAWRHLPVDYQHVVADTRYFGHLGLSPQVLARTPQGVSRELLTLPKNAKPAAVEKALTDAIKRAEAADQPVTIIGLHSVAALPTWSDTTRRQVLSLFLEHAPAGAYPTRQGYTELIQRIVAETRDQQNYQDIEPYIAGMWAAAASEDHPGRFDAGRALIQLAQAAYDAEATSAALALSASGMGSRATREMQARGSHGLPEAVTQLERVRGKASIALGIIDIPVDEQDVSYPIYKSQAEFAMGNTDTAWTLYNEHVDQFLPIIRSLTVPYSLWILERNIAQQETDRAQQIIRELTIWSRQEAGRFTPQQDAELKIAYADTAFLEGKLQTAKAWYRRVADAEQYRGTPLQFEAALKSVDVDRAEKNFSSAMNELDNLMRIRDENLRQRVHFARAEVLFDQENYAEAFNEVSIVLKQNPSHPDALILLGESQLQMRKLMDASEIELGITRDQEMIVPGETLKINLNDPGLHVSGIGADIEVEVVTKSGDRERVKLHQLGDDKTRFRAEIPTQLGERRTGDKVLQVLGRDEIRYGYSKRFREKMTDLPPDPDIVIEVASDAHLAASAGAFPRREGERRLNLEELGVSTAQQALGTRRVRPGNPIYLRVTDKDQSKTDEVDQVVVSISTSNGDVIPRVVLTETGTHTGEFEATVATGQAQAMAFASESAPGRDPNMVISDEVYPGWSGEVGSKAETQSLSIDLNDDVELGIMTITCNDADQAPTRFIVQTSMNGRNWITRARYPGNPPTWIGKPLITAIPTYGRNAIGISKPTGHAVPEDWYQAMEIASADEDVSDAAFEVPGLGNLDLDLPSGGHPGYSVLVRYRALFYQSKAEIRTFKLTGLPNQPDKDKPRTLLLIDGEAAPADAEDPLTIQRELQPGLHEIEIWYHDGRNEVLKRKPQLWHNVEGQRELVRCPDAMFDPATFPSAVREQLPTSSKVTAVKDADVETFEVDYGRNVRGRLVRLVIVDHQGPAPAISKIRLIDRQGETRLPVAMDYQQLRNNQQLEVIAGDRVSIRYEDDRTATPRRQVVQSNLQVAYNTATISASFLNYEMTDEGRKLVLEPIRRFKLDDAVGIVIYDPDMDQTREPDTVAFMVQADDGEPVMLEALETGPHTGEFLGRVFPVASQPKRDAEVMVRPGGTLTAAYLDAENLDPGIPKTRRVVLEHAQFTKPMLALYNVSSQPLPVQADTDDQESDDDDRGPEIIKPRHKLSFNYVEPQAIQESDVETIIGGTLRFDVLARHLAFADSSEITAYVQTDSGRRLHQQQQGETSQAPFDVNVPGTLKLSAKPSGYASTEAPAGYTLDGAAKAPSLRPPLDEGRFAFSVPVELGSTPTRSYANSDADNVHHSARPEALAVRPDDRIHIGFAYLDPQGKPQWATTSVSLGGHAFLDVMNDRYRQDLETAYVGEKLYLRLIAPNLDKTPERDITTVSIKVASGATTTYPIRETDFHSGVFKGSFTLSYADQPVQGELPSVMLHGLPVKYGDEVQITFSDNATQSDEARSIQVNKGADGIIEPFTKQYGEDAVAIRTTFTLAECYFELAKYHRQLGKESLARREMAQAQKLLAEAIAQHRDDTLKAHAEYLLGNLAQEYADLSKNDTSQRRMYQDALARFTKIPLDYAETEFAPKAQFKKGLVYEKLGELDIAVEEYVKLAYKYPDHELIPSVMSRLGSYFQAEGKAYKDEAEALEKREDDVEAQGRAIKLRELATEQYLNAAQIFAKLQERFPTDALAGLAGLRSAQNFMRAADYTAAIDGFDRVVANETYDDHQVRSQALFWKGISQERLSDLREAYETYRRVTFDFPDSIWAKQSRGRLADPAFARIIAEEELARERMLEALKEQSKRR